MHDAKKKQQRMSRSFFTLINNWVWIVPKFSSYTFIHRHISKRKHQDILYLGTIPIWEFKKHLGFQISIIFVKRMGALCTDKFQGIVDYR